LFADFSLENPSKVFSVEFSAAFSAENRRPFDLPAHGSLLQYGLRMGF
jgi:hypothetical protein